MFYQGVKIWDLVHSVGEFDMLKSYLVLVVVMSYDLNKCGYDMCTFLVLKKEKKTIFAKKDCNIWSR